VNPVHQTSSFPSLRLSVPHSSAFIISCSECSYHCLQSRVQYSASRDHSSLLDHYSDQHSHSSYSLYINDENFISHDLLAHSPVCLVCHRRLGPDQRRTVSGSVSVPMSITVGHFIQAIFPWRGFHSFFPPCQPPPLNHQLTVPRRLNLAQTCTTEYPTSGNPPPSSACVCTGLANLNYGSCTTCLNSNDQQVGQIIAGLSTYCTQLINGCVFQCGFTTCASSDVGCQCAESYLQDIYK